MQGLRIPSGGRAEGTGCSRARAEGVTGTPLLGGRFFSQRWEKTREQELGACGRMTVLCWPQWN